MAEVFRAAVCNTSILMAFSLAFRSSSDIFGLFGLLAEMRKSELQY